MTIAVNNFEINYRKRMAERASRDNPAVDSPPVAQIRVTDVMAECKQEVANECKRMRDDMHKYVDGRVSEKVAEYMKGKEVEALMMGVVESKAKGKATVRSSGTEVAELERADSGAVGVEVGEQT